MHVMLRGSRSHRPTSHIHATGFNQDSGFNSTKIGPGLLRPLHKMALSSSVDQKIQTHMFTTS
eukprot:358859-Chlamydomonas_euryale.AAC.15